jgi:transcriptional regulator with XRE-family HTH domain
MKDRTQFNKTLIKLRVDHNKTQTDIAHAFGFTKAYWSSVERGRTRISRTRLNDIASYFKLNDIETKELIDSYLVSCTDINISIEELSHDHRKLLLKFIDTLPSLEDEDISVITKLLYKK